MEIATTRTSGDVDVLRLNGRFDAYETPEIIKWVEENVSLSSAKVVVNLSGVNFIDSSALAVLVKIMKRCREHGGDLKLCNLQQPVLIIFELTRLDKAVEIFKSEEAAIRSFKG